MKPKQRYDENPMDLKSSAISLRVLYRGAQSQNCTYCVLLSFWSRLKGFQRAYPFKGHKKLQKKCSFMFRFSYYMELLVDPTSGLTECVEGWDPARRIVFGNFTMLCQVKAAYKLHHDLRGNTILLSAP